MVSVVLFGAATHTAGQIYLGVDLGAARAGGVTGDLFGVNYPTRCDRLLYANAADAPTDAACTGGTAGRFVTNQFGAATGFGGAVSLGYSMGMLRVELEYLRRRQPGQMVRMGGSDDAALQSKESEWSTVDPPSASLLNFESSQLGLNILASTSGSAVRFFAGGGVGFTRTDATYMGRWVRKTDLGDLEWQNSAEGTMSLLNASVSGMALGYQAVGGIEFALSGNTALVTKFRWSRSGMVQAENARWVAIRSHAPVQSDGTTPFTTTVTLDSISYLGLTVGLRYSFGGSGSGGANLLGAAR